MTRPRPTITCAACGETREHRAYGWCQPCYRRWVYRGRPAGGPPPVQPIDHADVEGTVPGWDLHMRRGTEPCDPCRAAHNADVRERYHANGRPRNLSEARHYTQAPTDWSAEQHRAALAAADKAGGAADCRTLLQALGLVQYEVAPRDRIGGVE